MKDNEYKIETFKDIVNCTNPDNLESFIEDLKGLLASLHLVKALSKATAKESEVKVQGSYIWTDDGKNKITVTLKAKDNK